MSIKGLHNVVLHQQQNNGSSAADLTRLSLQDEAP